MVDSGAAQNKLGELFVDIGVGGVGKALKSLNSVSATFLMTKNAAVQMAKPIVDVGKKTLGMAVDVGKIGSTLGMAYKDAYKLQYYFKHMNLNEGLINDIERLSEQFNQMRFLGSGALTGAQAQAFNVLGLNPMDYYGGGFEKIQQLIKDVQKKTAGMDRTLAANAVQGIGLNSDWLYAFDRGVFDLSDALSISNEEIEAAITASEDLNEANLALRRALEKSVITLTPYISKYAPILADAIVKYTPPLIDGITKLAASIEGVFQAIVNHPSYKNKDKLKSTAIATGAGAMLAGPVGAALAGGTTAAIQDLTDPERRYAFQTENYRPEFDKNLRQDLVKNPLYGSVYDAKMGFARYESPYDLGNGGTYQITINNDITGQNAEDIARKTSISTRDTIESMLNKYQVHTMPGK